MFNGDYLIHLAATMEKNDVEALICVMWGIWNDRNKVLHGGKERDPVTIASFTLSYIEKYRCAKDALCNKLQQPVAHQASFQQAGIANEQLNRQHNTTVNTSALPPPTAPHHPTRSTCHTGLVRSSSTLHQQPAATTRNQQNNLDAAASNTLPRSLDNITWTPPAVHMLKMNVDAAANFSQQTLGIGAVIRNYRGDVLAALSKRVQGCFRSDEMEAKALFHSLNWASQCPFSIDIVETDALRVSSALNSSHKDLSCFNDLIDDIRCLLSSFPRVAINHARRQANKAAHGLAKYALELDEDVSWIREIPYPIFSIIVNDC
ncbi:hypothetical protein CsatA_026453 [Cannabis sativa]